MKKPDLKNLFIESEDYRKTIPKTKRLRDTLIVLAGLVIFFIFADVNMSLGWVSYAGMILILVFIIKITYDAYKITQVFEKWERNYKKYKNLFE